RALDAPPTVTDFQPGTYVIDGDGTWGAGDMVASGTYADCAVPFVSRTSGRVHIHWSACLGCTGTNRTVRVAPEVREGSVIGSGAIIHTPVGSGQDFVGVIGTASGDTTTPVIRQGAEMLLEGLTPGRVYHARLLHRSSGGSSVAGIDRRRITVSPAT